MRKFNYQEFLNGPAHALLEQRASQLQDILLGRHENAPRGGWAINSFDQHRSAPGEDPAIEFGDLLDAILHGVTRTGRLQYDVVANRVGLEHGDPSEDIAPRPMGRYALEELRSPAERANRQAAALARARARFS